MGVHTTVKVGVPSVAAVVVVVIIPSQSMNHMFSPEVGHMDNSLYLHAQQIDKMCNISSSASSPYSACIHTLHVDAHILEKYDTMVHYHNSMGLLVLTTNSFENLGKYL